jgi:hypothetical protein
MSETADTGQPNSLLVEELALLRQQAKRQDEELALMRNQVSLLRKQTRHFSTIVLVA